MYLAPISGYYPIGREFCGIGRPLDRTQFVLFPFRTVGAQQQRLTTAADRMARLKFRIMTSHLPSGDRFDRLRQEPRCRAPGLPRLAVSGESRRAGPTCSRIIREVALPAYALGALNAIVRSPSTKVNSEKGSWTAVYLLRRSPPASALAIRWMIERRASLPRLLGIHHHELVSTLDRLAVIETVRLAHPRRRAGNVQHLAGQRLAQRECTVVVGACLGREWEGRECQEGEQDDG